MEARRGYLGALAAATLVLAMALIVPALSGAQVSLPVPTGTGTVPQVPDTNQPPADPRASEPIVMRGVDFGSWSVPANQTVKLPLTDVPQCNYAGNTDNCAHNHYAQPEVDTGSKLGAGTPTDRFLGYRWDANRHRFVQIPFQVDQVFTRYLDNSASGFAFYSGQDQHATYAFDREGWRYTASDPSNPCLAVPDPNVDHGAKTTPDPVPGLDDNDELSFMGSDGGSQAPAGTPKPAGIADVKEIKITNPSDSNAPARYVYVMMAQPGGPKPAFNASNGYVRYQRDQPLAGYFEFSQSNYDTYGNAATGVYCDASGHVVLDPKTGQPDIKRRRPRDYATVTTPRYRFRYDGRWLLTQLGISRNDNWRYGPDLIDRWKARAFQQDPSSNTPCCGFEEEDKHWGGSSTLLGELVGPVRAIRETWGADSGTNVIRRETFYRDSIEMKSYLRVHPIPPLDGIYAQWDFNAGQMTKFFNSKNPNGVAVDGRNDEAFGNLDDPCNDNYNANDTSQLDQQYRSFYRQAMLCQLSSVDHQSIDIFDPSFSQANVALEWTEETGPNGSIVSHYTTKPEDMTPGGTPQGVLAVPYYRDDSCFDDGTGTDPGLRVKPGSADEPRTTSTGAPRKCWHPEDGLPDGSDKYFQGDIGTQGVHLLFTGDTDNARQTVPIDQIVSLQDLVMLPGDQSKAVGGGQPAGAVGQAFGQSFSQPLQTQTRPATTVRGLDRQAPRVRLNARVDRRRHRVALRWSGTDLGGSGIARYYLQLRRRGGGWRTLAVTGRRSYVFRTHAPGVYSFRVRAVDGAGNASAWAARRVALARH